jgi:peptidyl-tRNA hydrolase
MTEADVDEALHRLRAELAGLRAELAEARLRSQAFEGEAAGLRYVVEQLRAARQRPARMGIVHPETRA